MKDPRLDAANYVLARKNRTFNFIKGVIVGSLLAMCFESGLQKTVMLAVQIVACKETSVAPERHGMNASKHTISFEGDFYTQNDVAKKLEQEVRVLCYINSEQEYLKKKIAAILDTWGKRCAKLLFFSSEKNADTSLGVIGLKNGSNGKNCQGAQTIEAFRYMAQHHLGDADWFLETTTENFVVLENLRHLLAKYDPGQPLYLGGFLNDTNHTQNGYAVSKRLLIRTVEEAEKTSLCPSGENVPNEIFGKVLEMVNATIVDIKDEKGRNRFLTMKSIDQRLFSNISHIYGIERPQTYHLGSDCCSNSAISFSDVDYEGDMYAYEFYMYHMQPFGISYEFSALGT